LKSEGGEILKRKALLVLPVLVVLALSIQALPVLANNGPLTEHARVEGMAIIRTGMGRPNFYSDALMIFWQYSMSVDYPGGSHPESGWAVTLTVDGTTYVWHVTEARFAGRSKILILKAVPHPGLPGLTEAPSPIKVILNHGGRRTFVVAFGAKVFFFGTA
jgi:hypothetical protein